MDPREAAKERIRQRDIKSGRERRTPRSVAADDKARSAFDIEKQAWKEKKAMRDDEEDGDSTLSVEERALGKGKHLQNENQTSLQNSIAKAREATQIGADTLNKLETQRSQMQRVDQDMDDIQASLKRSDRVMRGMKSFTGSIKNFFSKPKGHTSTVVDPKSLQDDPLPATTETDEKPADDEAEGWGEDELTATSPQKANAIRSLRDMAVDESTMTDEQRQAHREFLRNERREDAQLDELGNLLGQLKGQALDLNSELKLQTKYVNHLETQLQNTNDHMTQSNLQVKRL